MSTLNYTVYLAQISNLMVVPSTDSNFTTMLPGMIDYAEQRMYRELDLLATSITDGTGSLTVDTRDFTLPTTYGTFLVVDNFNVITPSTATSTSGTRNQCTMVTPDMIDAIYPSNSDNTGVPEFFAMVDNTGVIVGPSPDAAYPIEVRGTQRPTPLSSGNSSTILTKMLPDCFIAASMVFAAGYMRDFGGQADNPQMSQSWETQYKSLSQSANVEELRKTYQSQGWTGQQPNPIATPPRA